MANSLALVIGNKNYSSWSLRAWLAMKQAGLEFEEIRIPLHTHETRQQLLRYSPSGKVPVLMQGDLAIWESTAIGEYVAELVPDVHLLPHDPIARAIARSISAEMHAGFSALRSHLPMDCRSRCSKQITPEVEQDITRITTIWRECRQRFGAGGSFLFGHFTLADAMFAPVVSRFVTYGVALDAMAQAYCEAVWLLPAMQIWLEQASAESEVIPASLL